MKVIAGAKRWVRIGESLVLMTRKNGRPALVVRSADPATPCYQTDLAEGTPVQKLDAELGRGGHESHVGQPG